MNVRRFVRYAWGIVAYNLLVIVWGAYVRATGSGAGCGRHWPLCNGEVVPRSPTAEMIVEFTHRVTSGLSLLLVLGLVWWAWRLFPKGHPARRGAALTVLFMVTESLLGASLVLFGWVAYDTSSIRALVVALHLANTLFLLGSMTLTAWWASGRPWPHLESRKRQSGLLGAALLGVLFLGMSGAITALGDTLFPARSLAEGLRQDLSPTAHFLIRLRVIHPLLAVGIGLFLVLMVHGVPGREDRRLIRLAWVATGLVLTQWLVGLVNILLLVPVSVQLIHLLVADLLWITLVLYTAEAFAPKEAHGRVRSAPSPG